MSKYFTIKNLSIIKDSFLLLLFGFFIFLSIKMYILYPESFLYTQILLIVWVAIWGTYAFVQKWVWLNRKYEKEKKERKEDEKLNGIKSDGRISFNILLVFFYLTMGLLLGWFIDSLNHHHKIETQMGKIVYSSEKTLNNLKTRLDYLDTSSKKQTDNIEMSLSERIQYLEDKLNKLDLEFQEIGISR